MKPVARLVIDAVRNLTLADSLASVDDTEIIAILFRNYRENSTQASGMRLTPTGLDYVSRCFETYQFDNLADLTNRDLIFLDRACVFPYFVEAPRLVLFDRALAIKLRLYRGNLSDLRQFDE